MIPTMNPNVPMNFPNQMAGMPNSNFCANFLPTMGLNKALHQWKSPPVMMPNLNFRFDQNSYQPNPNMGFSSSSRSQSSEVSDGGSVSGSLVAKYSGQGILVDDDEVLRGPDVIRLHVKKYDALCSIEDALKAVENKAGQKII